jgi:hypothetical protein
VHINRLATLIDSYRLATEGPPPAGQVLVHNNVKHTPSMQQGARGFRAWWAAPATELVLCDCGWRSDLGEHYRVDRPISFAERVRRGRRNGVRPAA